MLMHTSDYASASANQLENLLSNSRAAKMVKGRSPGSGLVAVVAILAPSLAFQAPLRRPLARSHAQRVATVRAAAPVTPAAPPAPVDRRIQLAKAFVVDDFGRANPDLLQDDFAFELGSSLLTKDRYLKSDDLARLREACGDTLRVAASDFRIDPGDDEAVLFTLAVSGVQSAPYKGLEDKDPLKGSGPWKTLPTCGRCAFDASGKCYSATLGAPLDRCILRGDHFNLTWTPSTACLDSSLTQGRSLARRGDAC